MKRLAIVLGVVLVWCGFALPAFADDVRDLSADFVVHEDGTAFPAIPVAAEAAAHRRRRGEKHTRS